MSEALQPGTMLVSPSGARYKIVAAIGQGGFGITYRATSTVHVNNLRAEATFAIKELFIADDCERSGDTTVRTSGPASRRMAAALKDFIAEGRRLKQLGGTIPNVVNVSEVFEANDTAYYVMEFLDGMSLRDYIISHGPLDEASALQLLMPVIRAVASLHARRITHLDIKPGNIMLDNSDGVLNPVLIDFGQSKHYADDGSVTYTVSAAGFSDGYAPLEQYAGLSGFSPTADVYALAATLLFCLTGTKPPRSADITPDYINSALPATVSPVTRRTILRAMSLQSGARHADATEFLSALNDDPTVVVNDSDSKTVIAPPANKTNRMIPILLGVTAVAVIAVILYMVMDMLGGKSSAEDYPLVPPDEIVINDTDVAEEVPAVEEYSNAPTPSLEDEDNPVMKSYDLSGSFIDNSGKSWPVKLAFSTNDRGRFGKAVYTNVTYGIVLNMEGSGSNGYYTFYSNEKGADLTIKIRRDGNSWNGTATNGSKTLSVVLY